MSVIEPEKAEVKEPVKQTRTNKKKGVWTVIGIIAAVLLVVGVAGGSYLVHLSNTSPEFCATCHIMDRNVTSYLTSTNLDNLHQQANVGCKDCHDTPFRLKSGVVLISFLAITPLMKTAIFFR